MTENIKEYDHFAVRDADWAASLRIIEKENERQGDVYVEMLVEHLKAAKHCGKFCFLKDEDYGELLDTLGRFCEALERPYIAGILENLHGAKPATSDGEVIDEE